MESKTHAFLSRLFDLIAAKEPVVQFEQLYLDRYGKYANAELTAKYELAIGIVPVEEEDERFSYTEDPSYSYEEDTSYSYC